MTAFLAVAAGVALLGMLAMVALIRRLLTIAHPNEVLVLSGVRRVGANGRVVSYRTIRGGRALRIPLLERIDRLDTIRGGRALRIPLLERIDRLDLTTIDVELNLDAVPALGFVPCDVQGIARIGIADRGPELDNAVLRLMGLSREEIAELARELLGGTLRRVVAALRPEEAEADHQRLAGLVSEEIDGDFSRLGLVLSDFGIRSFEVRTGPAEALPRLGALGSPRPGPPRTT